MLLFGPMENIVRTHDSFYASESSALPPKESFVNVCRLIKAFKQQHCQAKLSIVDFGAATGTFVNYLVDELPDEDIKGLEYLSDLVDYGRRSYPNINLEQASILDKDSLPQCSVDIITVLGVISIFDDLQSIVANLSYWVKPGGKLIFHGMFNPYNVDVYIKYRTPGTRPGHLEAGWNIISQSTFEGILKSFGCKSLKFHEFNIGVDILQNPSDPLRSWTEKLHDGSRQIVNGLFLKQPQYIAEADF
jgi:SAM-dependent methyltransferase